MTAKPNAETRNRYQVCGAIAKPIGTSNSPTVINVMAEIIIDFFIILLFCLYQWSIYSSTDHTFFGIVYVEFYLLACF